MAFSEDPIDEQHARNWRGFVQLVMFGCAGVAIVLLLMAWFLL